ncbi:MAG: hypothetical protein CMN74_05875 [Sphingorhabdus sp.]|nr:hypothetical protein [Sphingorhabdus sp.]|tara:strand:- start:32 stop:1537 length:1506 start_codon:yes stop_codon:yes gene_type:complete
MLTATGFREPRPLAATDWHELRLFGVLVLFVLLLRFPYIGFPDIFIDEEFYLVVGDRLLNGQIPYVDVWDRKPIGLFLLFAGMRLLGGDAVVAYQLVAALFAIATSWFILLISRRYVGHAAALAGAIVYVAWLATLGGSGGQSPVFYNALTAAAGWMTIRSSEEHHFGRSSRWAFGAMIVCGLTLQIKYTAVIEGVFFGLAIIWTMYRKGTSQVRITRLAVIMIALALAPTAAALIFYAAIGHLDAFVYANFFSVFDRLPQPGYEISNNLRLLSLVLLPVMICLPAAVAIFTRHPDKKMMRGFLAGWLVAAVLGFALIGNYFDHYALPVLVPACLILAMLFDQPKYGAIAFLVLIVWALLIANLRNVPKAESRELVSAMTREIKPYTDRGATLYIDDAPMILYLETGAHAPWRTLFPFHLTDATEIDAVGVDTHAEMRKVIASSPGIILTSSAAFTPVVDEINRQALDDLIARNYVVTASFGRPNRRYAVNVRRDLIDAQR